MEDRGTSCVESKLAHSQPGIYFAKIVKVENISYGPNFCNDEIQCLQVITSHWRYLAAIGNKQKAKLY